MYLIMDGDKGLVPPGLSIPLGKRSNEIAHPVHALSDGGGEVQAAREQLAAEVVQHSLVQGLHQLPLSLSLLCKLAGFLFLLFPPGLFLLFGLGGDVLSQGEGYCSHDLLLFRELLFTSLKTTWIGQAGHTYSANYSISWATMLGNSADWATLLGNGVDWATLLGKSADLAVLLADSAGE